MTINERKQYEIVRHAPANRYGTIHLVCNIEDEDKCYLALDNIDGVFEAIAIPVETFKALKALGLQVEYVETEQT